MPIDDLWVEDDFDDDRQRNKWAILVDTIQGGWIVTQVDPQMEIGEYDPDLCRGGHEYKVGAFFDPNVEAILTAMTQIGGDGLDVQLRIQDLLSGICRSFVEANQSLKKE